ncbi:MAG: AarF/UbiB family protein [Elusimicrobiota bacterium]
MAVNQHQFEFEQKIDVLSIFREFERSITEELNLTLECKNAAEFRKILPAGFAMPEFYAGFCTKSVLVQSFAKGKNPLDIADSLKDKVINEIGEMLFSQILSKDLYHDDLHPGNIRIDADGKIILLDFGRVGRLTQSDRNRIIPLLTAIQSKDIDKVIAICGTIGQKNNNHRQEQLRISIANLFNDRLPATQMISTLFYECGSCGLEIKGVFLQLLKGISTFEGMAHRMNPKYDLGANIQQYVFKNKAKNPLDFFKAILSKPIKKIHQITPLLQRYIDSSL